jgi:hypothetical protein
LNWTRRAGALALFFHRLVEGRHIDGNATFATDIGSEIERKAECVVERECHAAVENPAFAIVARRRARDRLFEELHPVLERLAETFLFLFQYLCHALLVTTQFRIRVAHYPIEILDQLVEERRFFVRADNRGGSRAE